MLQEEDLKKNYHRVLEQIPDHVTLVAISKNHDSDKIKMIYDEGQRVFGENRVQELLEKQSSLPSDIQWHLVGHLQTNKVKFIAPFIHTIQSVDSEKILLEINKEAQKNNRNIEVYLQIKIAEEATKYGLNAPEAKNIFSKYLDGKFSNVNITGLMGMATFTDNITQIKSEFSYLKSIFDELSKYKKLQHLSMGMSDDFTTAIACGSTSVRVGSAIFGSRISSL